jgi:glutamate 5-kinase
MSDTRTAARGSSPNLASVLVRASSRRVVVKIGSSSLASERNGVAPLVEQVAELSREQRSFVIVSSGAIALGCQRLGYRTRPKDMGKLQAAAAAGQSVLMRGYDEAFAQSGIVAAQVLLTHGDLADRERLNNAREALAALIDAGSVPIINENDTVATEEIRFGDNDQLAAMVVPLVGADLLVLLTDVEGVLDERGRRIREMSDDVAMASLASTSGVGTGGMRSKVSAARIACQSGASVVIASARRPGVLGEILAGQDVGTRFTPKTRALRARKHWIAYTLRPRGDVLLDAGAVRAVASGRSSLLPIGVLGVRGEFNPGDAVRLVAADGSEVARGLSRLGAMDVARAAGKKRSELELVFGSHAAELVVVHKDDLVTELADKRE